jgi:hypothetical protein
LVAPLVAKFIAFTFIVFPALPVIVLCPFLLVFVQLI